MQFLTCAALPLAGVLFALLAPASVRAQTPGDIAYTNGDEIRVIDPRTGEDRLVWAVPDTIFGISKLIWNPAGTEIVFASNHEMATSFFERDLYGIQTDGDGLRKLTNPPLYDELDAFEKGTVTVDVINFSGDAGPFFVYVVGASAPQQTLLNPGETTNLTFTNVADLGDVFQHVVVISGIFRWWDAAVAADVTPGSTEDAGTLVMTSSYEHYGAEGPFWRSDGSRLGYFQTAGFAGTSTCLLEQVPVPPPYGAYSDFIFDPSLYETPCAVDWAPVPIEDEMLVTDYTDYTFDGLVHVYRTTEGSSDKGELIVTFDGYVQIYDIRWLPDASGFLVARHDALLERGLNLYEYRFDTGIITKLTDFTGENEGIRSFAISPDGSQIVFEYVENGDQDVGDLWIMARDGSDRRLLVENAASPHWAVASTVGTQPPAEMPQESTGRLGVYPQPSTTDATLSFRLISAQDLTLKVHDLLGREVVGRSLGMKLSGEHRVRVDVSALAPGIYVVSILGTAGARKVGAAVVRR